MQRMLTAMILAPIVLAGVFFLPITGFAVFIGIVMILAAWEWAKLAGFDQQGFRIIYAGLVGVVCCLSFLLPIVVVLSISGLWWLIVFWLVKRYPSSSQYLQNRILRLTMGCLTLVPAWYALVELKSRPDSNSVIALVLFIVWASDCGAYFVGKKIGRIRLAKNVSPGKTLEGLVGGLMSSVLISMLLVVCFNLNFILGIGLVMLSLLTSLVSVLGDLWESTLKRERGVKDSSQLLPGHGGILDRIDSLTAAIPIFTLALLISGY